jgi:hypothetical protein
MSPGGLNEGQLLTATSAPAAAPVPPAESRATLRALAGAEASRYARHPLFVLPCLVLLAVMAVAVAQHNGGGTDPMVATMSTAFLLGVFGFVVAHRLTTSMLRSRELAGTVPVGRQQRTLALCLACLVPAAAGTVCAAFMVVTGAIWPPEGDPSTLPVAWFGDYPTLDVLAVLLAMGPLATLGGPLLGVAVARWAPFRGSALLGVVILVVWTAFPASDARGGPGRLAAAWPVLFDEKVGAHEKIISTILVPSIQPVWALGWVLCLCGLAAVGALLRDPEHRRALLATAGGLTVGAAACFVLAVA